MTTAPALIETAIARESNAALARGALVSAGLGVLGAASVAITPLSGSATYPPITFGLTAAGLSVAVHLLARANRVTGATAWVVMLAFTSLPTLYFALTQLTLPSGAAAFIHGPITWTYFIGIVVSGTLFRPRLSVTVAAVAALGYLLCFNLAAPRLAELRGPAALLPDLHQPAIALIRTLMMLTTGLVIAGLAMLARRLTLRALVEQREKETVSRLLGEYVSEEVKAKLLTSPAAATGERREVAIMFCDVRDFTQLSEHAEPEAMVRRLNEYFDAMVEAIGREGGVVDKFVGDAVMAVFGGVVELEDPYGAAARAALAMRQRLARLRVQWAHEPLAPFENGIGLHAGPVLQGAIGAHHRKDFTVIGDPVNTAARIEGLTKALGCPILLSEPVFKRLPAELAARCVALGPHPVKGRSAVIELYALKSSDEVAA